VARLVATLLAVLMVLPAVALADGDPASDVLVFPEKSVFYPIAPAASEASKARLEGAVKAANDAHFPIKVAVISGPGDLGAVPQLAGQPQNYADFLAQEITFGYKDTLLIVMPEGYGLSGTHDAALKAAVVPLAKPKSDDPTDLVNAAADAVKAVAAAGGVNIAVPAAPAGSTTQAASSSSSSSSSGSSTLLFVGGGTVLVVALLVGLLIWVRRAPATPHSS
jgi:hypothetical protein